MTASSAHMRCAHYLINVEPLSYFHFYAGRDGLHPRERSTIFSKSLSSQESSLFPLLSLKVSFPFQVPLSQPVSIPLEEWSIGLPGAAYIGMLKSHA